MSITTSARFNLDTLLAALPAGASVNVSGDPTAATAKTVTFTGTDDATGQSAVTTAAGQFVDRTANQATLQQQAQTALASNRTFIAATKPSTAAAQASAAYDQTVALSRYVDALIRLALAQFDATN